MNIFVNQKKIVAPKESTIINILENLDIENKYLAVEVNETILPKSEYDKYIIQENDKIEIINAIGGG
ncbi:MAG: sulfur carrier protein ThiS [Pelagibacterales bacterium]|nr:sulfur carrier protein ThiS [Pelagibacterales bacterium]|tara:strand:- start:1617 stop:1817 length:201 start_codon:yes stop_codon:yes gene_type:complete